MVITFVVFIRRTAPERRYRIEASFPCTLVRIPRPDQTSENVRRGRPRGRTRDVPYRRVSRSRRTISGVRIGAVCEVYRRVFFGGRGRRIRFRDRSRPRVQDPDVEERRHEQQCPAEIHVVVCRRFARTGRTPSILPASYSRSLNDEFRSIIPLRQVLTVNGTFDRLRLVQYYRVYNYEISRIVKPYWHTLTTCVACADIVKPRR